MSRLGRGSEEFPEAIGCQPSVSGDSAHGERVDWIVPRNRNDSGVIGHDDVLALARDTKADLLKRSNGI